MSDEAREIVHPITGYELFRLPEFIALCERLGIDWKLPTRHLTIEVPVYPEDAVKITQTYLTGGHEAYEKSRSIDTTSSNNTRFVTRKMPADPASYATGGG